MIQAPHIRAWGGILEPQFISRLDTVVESHQDHLTLLSLTKLGRMHGAVLASFWVVGGLLVDTFWSPEGERHCGKLSPLKGYRSFSAVVDACLTYHGRDVFVWVCACLAQVAPLHSHKADVKGVLKGCLRRTQDLVNSWNWWVRQSRIKVQLICLSVCLSIYCLVCIPLSKKNLIKTYDFITFGKINKSNKLPVQNV